MRDIRLFLPRIKIFRCVLCNLQFTSFAIELENTRGVELSSEFSLNSNSDLARRFKPTAAATARWNGWMACSKSMSRLR